jgi:hypothetical protein
LSPLRRACFSFARVPRTTLKLTRSLALSRSLVEDMQTIDSTARRANRCVRTWSIVQQGELRGLCGHVYLCCDPAASPVMTFLAPLWWAILDFSSSSSSSSSSETQQEAVLEFLLSKADQDPARIEMMQHVRRMADVVELKLTRSPDYVDISDSGFSDRGNSAWCCPITALQMNGFNRCVPRPAVSSLPMACLRPCRCLVLAPSSWLVFGAVWDVRVRPRFCCICLVVEAVLSHHTSRRSLSFSPLFR